MSPEEIKSETNLKWLRIICRNSIALVLTITFCVASYLGLDIGDGFIGIYGGVIGFYFKSEDGDK